MKWTHGDVYKCSGNPWGDPFIVINKLGNPCYSCADDLHYWAGSDTSGASEGYVKESIGGFVENVLVTKGCWMDVFGITHKKIKGEKQ